MRIQLYVQLVVLCCAAFSILAQSSDDPNRSVIISLGQGQELKGLNTTTASGDLVYKFYGIPYAVPPLGDLRFKPPEPAQSWTGVKDADTKSAICPQLLILPNEDLTSVKSEDCLYLNVFTPDVKSSLPVLVWIHGGGYRAGSAFNDGDGATLAPRGIVSVTINYRLGPFGFLSTGDDVMPGNYGMLDQVLALKWVQKYIGAFGGDPSQVTIGGESAGAHSVSLLNVSPLTKGLFKRVVLESGSSLALSAVERPGTKLKVKEATLRSASRVGCNQVTSAEVLQCLQKVDVAQLMNATQDAVTTPRIETIFGFLPDDPFNLLRDGNYNKVDTLHGTNTGEFSGGVEDPENDGVTNQQFIDTVRSTLTRYINVEEMARLVGEAYIGNETDPFILRTKLVQAVADMNFGGATLVEIVNLAANQSAGTKHFLYEFDYRISGTPTPAWRGVDHAAERRFVFYPDTRFQYTTPDDRAVGEAVQTMWVNFIKYGDPTPSSPDQTTTDGNNLVKWTEFTKDSPNMLKIDAQSTLVTYPRNFLFNLFEKLLEIMKLDVVTPIIG